VQNPALYHKHGDQMLLTAADSWVENYEARMRAGYAAAR